MIDVVHALSKQKGLRFDKSSFVKTLIDLWTRRITSLDSPSCQMDQFDGCQLRGNLTSISTIRYATIHNLVAVIIILK